MEKDIDNDTASQVADIDKKLPKQSSLVSSENTLPDSSNPESKVSDEEKQGDNVGFDGAVHKVWENIQLDLKCMQDKSKINEEEEEDEEDDDDDDEELNKIVENIIRQPEEEEPSDWEDNESDPEDNDPICENKESSLKETVEDNPKNNENGEFVLILSDEEGDEEVPSMSDVQSDNILDEGKDIVSKDVNNDKTLEGSGPNSKSVINEGMVDKSLLKGAKIEEKADTVNENTLNKKDSNDKKCIEDDEEIGDLLIDEDHIEADEDPIEADDNVESDEEHIEADDNIEADKDHIESDEEHIEADQIEADEEHIEVDDHLETDKDNVEADEDNVEENDVEDDEDNVKDDDDDEDNVEADEENIEADKGNNEANENLSEADENQSVEDETHSEAGENHSEGLKGNIQVDMQNTDEDRKNLTASKNVKQDGRKTKENEEKVEINGGEIGADEGETEADEIAIDTDADDSRGNLSKSKNFKPDDRLLQSSKAVNLDQSDGEPDRLVVDIEDADSVNLEIKKEDKITVKKENIDTATIEEDAVDVSSSGETQGEKSVDKATRKRSVTDNEFPASGEQVEVKKVKLDLVFDEKKCEEDVKPVDGKFEVLQNGFSGSEDSNSLFKDQDKPFDKEITLTSTMLEDIIVQKVYEHVLDNRKSCIAALRQKCLELDKILDKWRRKSMLLQKQVGDVILEYHKQLAKASSRPKVSTRTVGVNVRMMQAPTRTVGVNVRIMTDPDQDDPSTRKSSVLPSGSHRTSTQLSQVSSNKCVAPKRVISAPLKGLTAAGLSNNSVTITATTPDKCKPPDKNAAPVPMHLIANTATGQSSLSISSVSSPSVLNKPRITPSIISKRPIAPASVPSTSAIVVLATTNAVNSKSQISVIDLTKEDGESASAASNSSSAVVFSGSPSSTVSGGVISSQPLPRGTVALSASPSGMMSLPIMSSLPSLPSVVQLIPSGTVNQSVGTGTSVRMARPTAPVMQTTLQQGPRVAYLVPQSSGALTVVPRVDGPTNQLTTVPTVSSQGPFVPGTRQQLPTILLRMNAPPTPTAPVPAPPPHGVPALAPPSSTPTSDSRISSSLSVRKSLLAAPSESNQVVQTSKPQSSSVVSNSNTMVLSCVTNKHPAPLPPAPVYRENKQLKSLPPKPALKISKVTNGIVLSWNMTLNAVHADIVTYQLYAYQENSGPPSSTVWKKVGDVKALPLPMACTLTQFVEGHKYHFAVRAVDAHNRLGPFSDPASILLVAKPSEGAK